MLRRLLSVLLLCVLAVNAGAQELNCKVVVLHDKISGVDVQVFTGMQKAISDFMNTHKWTTDDYAPTEKIDCNVLINLTGNKINGDEDGYSATISVQATRPVFNSGYNSPTINYVDRDMIFHYSQFNTLQFDDNRVNGTDAMASNLTAILAYYSYLILALDYDSFSPNGGTTYLKRAQNVVSNAPDSKGITGWKAVDGTHNRYWIIDQLLNTRFQDVRNYWYTLHREGLDSMYTKPEPARMRILTNISKLFDVNKENPSSVLLQFFFNAKSDELLRVLSQIPKAQRAQFITMLDALDVPNAVKYNSLK